MKTKRIIALILVIVSIGLLASCEMITDFIDSRTRPIPLIQIYNSNFEKTLKMIPNDTLYVKVQGLEPDKEYTIQCLDPQDNVITELIVESNAEGIIDPSPIWYDIGFRMDPDTGLMSLAAEDVTLKAFHIRVADNEATARGNTDFRLPFFFISSNDNYERPQPIVMAGKQVGGTFTMENAFYSDQTDPLPGDEAYEEGTPLTNKLYVDVAQMTALIEGAAGLDHDVRIWILPHTGENFSVGERIVDNALFYIDFTVDELMNDVEGVHIPWPAEEPINAEDVESIANQPLIPSWAENRAFSVFLDMRDSGTSGIYQVLKEGFESFYLDSIDGNGVAGFIVKPPPPDPADYISLQLASGGVFSGRYESYIYNGSTYYRYVYDYDYRDTFIKSGTDTKYSYYSGSYIYWGKGIKVIWNPYRTPAGWQASGHEMPSSFWGRYVDVYVVDAENFNLDIDENPLIPATGTRISRIPVQYGCYNGYYQQTIWRAPMLPGKYFLIVDMDMNGLLTDNDLVDDIKSATDTEDWGFSVID